MKKIYVGMALLGLCVSCVVVAETKVSEKEILNDIKIFAKRVKNNNKDNRYTFWETFVFGMNSKDNKTEEVLPKIVLTLKEAPFEGLYKVDQALYAGRSHAYMNALKKITKEYADNLASWSSQNNYQNILGNMYALLRDMKQTSLEIKNKPFLSRENRIAIDLLVVLGEIVLADMIEHAVENSPYKKFADSYRKTPEQIEAWNKAADRFGWEDQKIKTAEDARKKMERSEEDTETQN
ncbi:MAG: hypothetical protein UU47_C0016G0015 [candidate division TM6 bacterium GW2011_GWE2_41_16]|nr:MAG: hypothetical protein UU47_C0016G0015 [candidate division TM6 bacterium GW2011_GWE2_41_16]